MRLLSAAALAEGRGFEQAGARAYVRPRNAQSVTPAKAGVQAESKSRSTPAAAWIPAFAGMTKERPTHDHHRRPDRHPLLRPHPDGQLPGRLAGASATELGAAAVGAAVERAGVAARGDREDLHGLRPPRRPRPGAGAAGGAQGGPRHPCRGDHGQQDVRLGHAGRDHGRRHDRRRLAPTSSSPAAWRA